MSADEEKKYLDELAIRMHSSRDKEVSGLFREIKQSITELRQDVNHDLDRLETAINRLQEFQEDKILPNINSWNKAAANWERIGWYIGMAVLGALFAANQLFS